MGRAELLAVLALGAGDARVGPLAVVVREEILASDAGCFEDVVGGAQDEVEAGWLEIDAEPSAVFHESLDALGDCLGCVALFRPGRPFGECALPRKRGDRRRVRSNQGVACHRRRTIERHVQVVDTRPRGLNGGRGPLFPASACKDVDRGVW